jgi:hypothetical protein
MTNYDIHVQRQLYAAAPDGIAIYAQNPCYTSTKSLTLVESYKHEALAVDHKGHRTYYHPRILRRYSPDNGGTWHESPDQSTEHPDHLAGRRRQVSLHALDASRNALISLHCTYDVDPSQDSFAPGILRRLSGKLWYEISFDAGKTWSHTRQVIDHRPGHDDAHWAPDIAYGRSGAAIDLAAPIWLPDGSLLFGLTLQSALLPHEQRANPNQPGRRGVAYIQARWNPAGTDLLWTMGGSVILTAEQSHEGCAEPTAASLPGNRLFNVVRCQGMPDKNVYSTRYTTLSLDSGATWSTPTPLLYDDGQPVFTPASLSSFIHSAKTNRWYWLANILPSPVHGQTPRYPLTIAQFNPDTLRIIKASVRPIQERNPGLPDQVRYTNWGLYEERNTGDLIMTLPEQPKLMDFTAMTKPEHFTADCFKYRIQLPD